MPVTVDLPARSCRALLGARRELQSLGLNVEDFGADTVAISAVAPYLKGDQVEELLKEALELILSQPRKQGIEEERMKNLALAASRRALSSSKRMEVVEAQSLTRQLFDCAAPFQCPLGRPTMAHLSREHIGQLFTASRS